MGKVIHEVLFYKADGHWFSMSDCHLIKEGLMRVIFRAKLIQKNHDKGEYNNQKAADQTDP